VLVVSMVNWLVAKMVDVMDVQLAELMAHEMGDSLVEYLVGKKDAERVVK